jgi:cell pole-organizing protein PopZ
MSQAAKVQEPSMEEILASIRRIIADDDASKPAKAPEPAPSPPPAAAAPPPAPPPPEPAPNDQSDVDAMMAELEAPQPLPPEPAPEPPPEPKFEAAAEPAAPPPAADVLDLTEAMAAPSPASNFRTIDGSADVVFTDRPPEPPPAAVPAPAPREYTRPSMPDHALLSNNTAAAVDSAFNTLAATVIGQNARTLEDLVKEMLRPMLKSWLDDNLPGLVDRIVRAEIERVSRGKP